MGIAMNAPLQTSSLFRPATRLSSIGVSEILKITGLATDLKRQGKDVIILGAGEPDFDTPAHIKDAAARAMHAGATKYTEVLYNAMMANLDPGDEVIIPTPQLS
jgi:aspartate aminotransferase